MTKNCCFAVFLVLLPALAGAQSPHTDSVWIEAGNLRICLRADGSLHSGAPGGAVQYRHYTLQSEPVWVKVVQDAGLWFGGTDPGGSLALSVQTFEPRVTDFRVGFAGVPGSGKIWSVTYDQIVQHVADYSDNGYIDHPIEAIFAWPGFGNLFFEAYNGFELPDGYLTKGNFVDLNSNQIYEPHTGDFPHNAEARNGSGPYFPERLFCFAFYSQVSDMFPGFRPYPVQGIGYLCTYDCPATLVYDNAFFVTMAWRHIGTERCDSSIIGLFLNPDIGQPDNDYHGSYHNSYFAYNATGVDGSAFGNRPPVLMVSSIWSPFDKEGVQAPTRVMPIGLPGAIPQATAFPILPAEYYNYLTCAWRDGLPLTNKGNGYNTWGTDETTMVYYGNPYDPANWSEVNQMNSGGDRIALMSWNFKSLEPGAYNRMSYMLAVHPDYDGLPPHERFENMFEMQREVIASFDGYLDPQPYTDPRCRSFPRFSFPHLLLRPYPNPASEVLNIQIEGGAPEFVRLYDALGRMVLEQQTPCDLYCKWDNPVQLPVAHLPRGMYYLEVVALNSGQKATRKVVIAP
jgi:hypothetical protein